MEYLSTTALMNKLDLTEEQVSDIILDSGKAYAQWYAEEIGSPEFYEVMYRSASYWKWWRQANNLIDDLIIDKMNWEGLWPVWGYVPISDNNKEEFYRSQRFPEAMRFQPPSGVIDIILKNREKQPA